VRLKTFVFLVYFFPPVHHHLGCIPHPEMAALKNDFLFQGPDIVGLRRLSFYEGPLLYHSIQMIIAIRAFHFIGFCKDPL
jgi:hypothetical protein